MNGWKTVWGALVMACWLPCTVHCEMKSLPLLQPVGCCDRADPQPQRPDSDCNACLVCQALKGGGYDAPKQRVALSLLPLAQPVAPSAGLSELASLRQPLWDQPDTGPPELPKTWHFLLRAAPPVRAPSVNP